MRLNEAMPWMQQYEALRQRKLGIEPEEGDARPKALQNLGGAGKAGKNAMKQQGLSLSDVLKGMLPAGIGGMDSGYSVDATGRKQPSEAVSNQLAEIDLKLKSGKPLSEREMKLLEKYNPDLYQEAKKIEAERKQYEQELANCKSKEDVQNLKLSKLSKFSAEIQAVARSNMSKADKAAAMEAIGRRMTNAQEVYNEFVESGAYDALPDKRPELEPKDKDEVKLPEEQLPEPEETEVPEDAPETETKVETLPDGTVVETEVPVQPQPGTGDKTGADAPAKAEGQPRAAEGAKASQAAPDGEPAAREGATAYGPTGSAPKAREDEPVFFSISI